MVSAVDYTVRESGLQQDQPPAVGNNSSLVVVILKNDNAEGILEFRQDFVDITGESQNKGNLELLKRLFVIYKIDVFSWVSFFQLRRMWALCRSQW